METELSTFVNEEVKRRGWSFRHLAKLAGVSHTTVVNIVSGSVEPTPVVCRGLAKAFDVPSERIYAMAGILPDYGEVPPEVMAWGARLNALSEYQRGLALDMIERVLRIVEGNPDSSPPQI